MNLESSARPAKKRVKKVTATTTAPVPSIRVREPSFDGKPGRSRSISQASLTSTRPPNSKASSSTSSGPFIQKDRCIKFNPSVPRCHACIGKKTGELCRYLDLRQFPGGTPQNPSGLPIWIDDPREPQEVFYPPYWNVSPTLPQTKRVLKVVADALLPYLAKELSHTRLPEIIRRNRELECRASCGTLAIFPRHIDYCAHSPPSPHKITAQHRFSEEGGSARYAPANFAPIAETRSFISVSTALLPKKLSNG